MPRRCKDERAAVVAYLREGGSRAPDGAWYAWDSEMRSYAKGFSDNIESGMHLKTTK
jgi:hypothetical protein